MLYDMLYNSPGKTASPAGAAACPGREEPKLLRCGNVLLRMALTSHSPLELAMLVFGSFANVVLLFLMVRKKEAGKESESYPPIPRMWAYYYYYYLH